MAELRIQGVENLGPEPAQGGQAEDSACPPCPPRSARAGLHVGLKVQGAGLGGESLGFRV